jgi:hypothetical protein
LKAHTIDIENTIESCDQNKRGPWAEKARACLREAEKALTEKHIECGWRLLNEAELLAIYGYDDERLKNVAKTTAEEANSKLKDWRKDAVAKILTTNVLNAPTANDVFVAQEIIKENNNNMHLKNNVLENQYVVLFIIAMICMFFTIITLPFVPSVSVSQNHLYLFVIGIIGGLGGAISGITSINKASKEEKVPDLVLNYWVTVLRPVIGASSAIAIVLFVLSGLFTIGNVTTISRELLLSIAFISGFSEKLLLNVVEKTVK